MSRPVALPFAIIQKAFAGDFTSIACQFRFNTRTVDLYNTSLIQGCRLWKPRNLCLSKRALSSVVRRLVRRPPGGRRSVRRFAFGVRSSEIGKLAAGPSHPEILRFLANATLRRLPHPPSRTSGPVLYAGAPAALGSPSPPAKHTEYRLHRS